MKYTEEIKNKAADAAIAGMHLKQIQTEIGPNPKATERYLAKRGLTYAKVLEDLKAKGIEPRTLVQTNRDRERAKIAAVKAEAKRLADIKKAEEAEKARLAKIELEKQKAEIAAKKAADAEKVRLAKIEEAKKAQMQNQPKPQPQIKTI